jgi:hypothetical protein
MDVGDLRAIPAARARLDAAELALIDGARRDGATWADVAEALGLGSRQAAEQRQCAGRRLDRRRTAGRAVAGLLMFGPVALAIPLGSAVVGQAGARPLLLAAAAIAVAAGAFGLRASRAGRAPAVPGGLAPPAADPGRQSSAAAR